MIEIKINKVVDALIEMSQLMGVDYKTIWDNYMHELITNQFTWEEVKEYMNNMREQNKRVKWVENYLKT